MDQIELSAEKREITGKKVKHLRNQGLVPGIIYGSAIEPTPVQFDALELYRVLRQAGASRLINVNLKGDKQPRVALLRAVQRDVITRNLLHVDFQEVVMTEKITSEVPVIIEGTSPAVESGEGMLNQVLETIQMEALPSDLMPSITVDVSPLEAVDDAIFVRDLEVPSGVTILTNPDETVVRISAAVLQAEELEEEEIGEEVEVVVAEEGGAPEDANDEG